MFAKEHHIIVELGELYMKFRIVNLKKFLRSLVLVFLVILAISFIIGNKSFSHTESKYKTICVSSGDTLWSIAKEEQKSNAYFEDKDIRYIVNNIKTVNNLSNSDLSINQTLIIPSI
jgi:lipopolysaccharide export LptBFGC system permease protein LptF